MKDMKDEMQSLKENGVWDLTELHKGYKPVSYKWLLKKYGILLNYVKVTSPSVANGSLRLRETLKGR